MWLRVHNKCQLGFYENPKKKKQKKEEKKKKRKKKDTIQGIRLRSVKILYDVNIWL